MGKRFDKSKYKNLRPATNVPGMKLHDGHRIEAAVHRESGKTVFVLDRHEILSNEDGLALSLGKDRLPPSSSSYNHRRT